MREAEDLTAFEDQINGATQTRPELDLTGDRSLEWLGSQSGIENKGIGGLD